jgi:alkanesulfonate monooxygenase SsuD/methylene tetrahydromethanopterin reductase-like flavin-dependent oxidoreductase (luciferase family)
MSSRAAQQRRRGSLSSWTRASSSKELWRSQHDVAARLRAAAADVAAICEDAGLRAALSASNWRLVPLLTSEPRLLAAAAASLTSQNGTRDRPA